MRMYARDNGSQFVKTDFDFFITKNSARRLTVAKTLFQLHSNF